eukprot:2907435-Prorocentrum_lima.AAC.1
MTLIVIFFAPLAVMGLIDMFFLTTVLVVGFSFWPPGLHDKDTAGTAPLAVRFVMSFQMDSLFSLLAMMTLI